MTQIKTKGITITITLRGTGLTVSTLHGRKYFPVGQPELMFTYRHDNLSGQVELSELSIRRFKLSVPCGDKYYWQSSVYSLCLIGLGAGLVGR